MCQAVWPLKIVRAVHHGSCLPEDLTRVRIRAISQEVIFSLLSEAMPEWREDVFPGRGQVSSKRQEDHRNLHRVPALSQMHHSIPEAETQLWRHDRAKGQSQNLNLGCQLQGAATWHYVFKVRVRLWGFSIALGPPYTLSDCLQGHVCIFVDLGFLPRVRSKHFMIGSHLPSEEA